MKKLLNYFPYIIFLAACSNPKVTEEKAAVKETNIVQLTDVQIKNAGIVSGKPDYQSLSATIKLNGKIEALPQNMVSVSVPLGGYIKQTSLLPGMYVAQGQTIAVVQDNQYIQLQQDYLTAKARLAYLKSEYERQKDLNASKATSDKAFDQSLADYKSDQVLVKSLEEKLSLAGIDFSRLNESNISKNIAVKSPINGYVAKVNVNIGKYVSATDVLFEIINPSQIHLLLKVFEKDLPLLNQGQILSAYSNNDTVKRYKGTIQFIGKDLNTDRSTDVVCMIQQPDKTLLPGTYMNAEIEVKTGKVFTLPEEAVVHSGGKNYVFIVKGKNEFEMTEVMTGVRHAGSIEVQLPLNVKDSSFITKGAYTLLMSLKNTSDEE